MREALLACAIVAITAGGARADGIGVIATGDRAAASAIVTAIGAERGRVVDDAAAEARAALAAGAVPLATLARFRGVRDAVAEGWRAYLQVSIEFAASRLASARTEAEALIALPGGAEVYADASLRLGAVLAHLGRTDESRAVLRLALALDPGRPVTVAEFSPDVLQAVDAARASVPPTQRVRITAQPAGGAMIELDGKSIGRAPLEVDIERGQHALVARAPGFEAHAEAVAVDDTHSVFELVLDPATDATRLASPPAGRDAVAYVEAVLTFAELDDVVLVAATERRGGPALVVQRCSGIPVACSAVVEIGYADASGVPAAARAAWQAVRGGELRYPPLVFGSESGVPVVHRCAVCRSPWLWGGVAAAAIATAAIVIAVTSGSRPPPVVAVDPGVFGR